ncbi:hypothetical protein ACHQM5_001954 [Ranunculus cassubicifolius]
MDLEVVKRFLEGKKDSNSSSIESIPQKIFDPFIMQRVKVDLIEPGRVLCSMKVPPRLLEEIEIDARCLRVGKAVGVVSVELRKKNTGKIFAQGRHTKYLAISSKI